MAESNEGDAEHSIVPSVTNASSVEDGRLVGKFVSDNVVNISSKDLSESEISLLSKGLTFSPTPRDINISEIKQDLETFGRKLRLKWHFREEEEEFTNNPFKKRSNFNPRNKDASIEIYLSRIEEEILSIIQDGGTNKINFDNLTREERVSLENLKNDKNIVIKGADKGSAVIVWDREDYLKEAEKQLGDTSIYTKIIDDPVQSLKENIKKTLSKIRERRDIPLETLDYFMVNKPKLGRFYLLPKIHKRLNNVPGRPVISNCGYHTENISAFLDFHLQPLSRKVKSFIKDTNDFLCKLRHLSNLPANAIMCTIDVVGLYPNIPNDEGLEALFNALEEREEKSISSRSLVELAELVLKNNFFEFYKKNLSSKTGDSYRYENGTTICNSVYGCHGKNVSR